MALGRLYGHMGSTIMRETGVLIKETPESTIIPSGMQDTESRWVIYLDTGFPWATSSLMLQVLNLLASKLVRNASPLLLSRPACGTPSQRHKWTKHIAEASLGVSIYRLMDVWPLPGVNNAAKKQRRTDTWPRPHFHPSRWTPGSGISGTYGNSIFNFCEKLTHRFPLRLCRCVSHEGLCFWDNKEQAHQSYQKERLEDKMWGVRVFGKRRNSMACSFHFSQWPWFKVITSRSIPWKKRTWAPVL